MTTQTKAADPVLPPLPFGFHSPGDDWLGQIAGSSNRAQCVADIEAYGRACYEKARADLIASMDVVAYLNDSATAAITVDQMHSLQHHQGSPGRSVAASYAGQPLAIIPKD